MQLTDDMLNWIAQHSGEDPAKLRFRYSDDTIAKYCILQIECRRKAAKKLPDTLQNQRFQFPTSLSAEQSTSDSIAEFHASLIQPGEQVLDMTAGLGIDAFHISRHGANVTAIDINPAVAEALSDNATALGLSINAICADSVTYLTATDQHFDTIFIDPARRGDGGKRLFALSDCTPDVVSLLPLLRQRCGRLIIKASPMIDIDQTLREVTCATHIYVTGTRHECKELVVVCDFTITPPADGPIITAVTTYDDTTLSEFSFTLSQERQSDIKIAEPHPGQVLYEPHPAIMKCGAYRLLCSNYGCAKLHRNTHLYISDNIISKFPGAAYRIETVTPFSSKEIKNIHKYIESGSVGVRNFVMTAAELSKKLRLKENSSRRIIGTTTESGRVLIAVCPINELN